MQILVFLLIVKSSIFVGIFSAIICFRILFVLREWRNWTSVVLLKINSILIPFSLLKIYVGEGELLFSESESGDSILKCLFFFLFTKLGIEFQWKPSCSLNTAKKGILKRGQGCPRWNFIGSEFILWLHTLKAGQSYFLGYNINVAIVLKNAYMIYLIHRIKL